MKAPPLFVSYITLKDYLSALNPELREEFGDEISRLVKRKLPPVVSKRCLAVLFGYSIPFMSTLSENSSKYYRSFTITTGKKTRSIKAPRVALKVIQKWFGYHLAESIPFDPYVYGFVPGRSSIDAAAKHCRSAWVYSVDIENFFPTTRDDVVKEELVRIGYSEYGAKLITRLCCYKNPREIKERPYLGQGAPSSPVLSNLVMKPIDKKLNLLADNLGITFTRYVDDIVFSGISAFPESLGKDVEIIFNETSWKLSPNKKYFADAHKGQRLKVHGLLVNGEKPRLTKGYRNKIRAYKHLYNNNEIQPKDENRIKGHILYAESVNNWKK